MRSDSANLKSEFEAVQKLKFHTPALLKESIDFLKVQPGKLYFDLTVGGGGSSLEILKRGGEVFALDFDPEAVDFSRKRLASACPSGVFKVVCANFATLKEEVQRFKLPKPAGIILDLGTSHFQIKSSGRGFTFEKEEPLDMRMDTALGVTAADLIKVLSQKQLTRLFRELGEERHALSIAKAIVVEREKKQIRTTKHLADLLFALYKGKRGRLHPATKVFQALRIAINSELENLEKVLPQALLLLEKNGRLVVISFHRLEDRIVKNFFKEKEKEGEIRVLTKKPIRPVREEILKNPRARSARLRAAEKTR